MTKEERLKDYLEGYESQYQFIGVDKIEHSLNNDIKELLQENKQLKERIDKSIEYISLDKSSNDTFSKREDTRKIIFTKEELGLLEILKGDINE